MKKQEIVTLRFIVIGALLLCGRLSWGAEPITKSENSLPKPRVIALFVDMSGSMDQARVTACKEAFGKIYQNLRQGDRVVVGTITSRSYIDFKPAVDEEIPKKSLWDNRLQFEKAQSRAKERIRSEVNKLLSQKHDTSQTEILDSLNIADSIFHDEKERQKILVIFSDMIEDSKEYHFDKDKITEEYIAQVIRERGKNNLLPNLGGVKVYVAGASANDSEKFRAILTFWTRYFAESRADFSPYRYGHSLIHFENGA